MQFQKISWSEVEELYLTLVRKIKEDNVQPDCIVAIERSGVIPARLLCEYLHIIFCSFHTIDVKSQRYDNGKKYRMSLNELLENVQGKKILVVDDVSKTGRALRECLQFLEGQDVITACLVAREDSNPIPDYYGILIPKDHTIVCPWRRMKSINDE